MHEYSYEYERDCDQMSRRNSWSLLIICLFDSITLLIYHFEKSNDIQHGWNAFHFIFIIGYEYYSLPLIQRPIQNISIGFYSICFFLTIQLIIIQSLSINIDYFLSLFLIIPLAWKIGYQVSDQRHDIILENSHQLFKEIYIQSHVLQGSDNETNFQNFLKLNKSNLTQTLWFDIYVRHLLLNVKCFFDDYSNSQFGILLQDIIELHKQNCNSLGNMSQMSCFCKQVEENEDSHRSEFLDQKWRFKYLDSFIIKLFSFQIQLKERIQQNVSEKQLGRKNNDGNILKFRLISYLIEIQQNETLVFKELLQLGRGDYFEQYLREKYREEGNQKKDSHHKNKKKIKYHIPYRQLQVLHSLYRKSISKFKCQQDYHLKGKQHEQSILFSIMQFDEKMSSAMQILKRCIEDKQIIVKNLSLDEIDIEQLYKDGCELREKRTVLKQILVELIKLNSSSTQLEVICQFLDETINFDGSFVSKLKKKRGKLGDNNNSKSKQIYLTMQKFYYPDSAVAFVSLMSNPGKIVKVSNNFSQVVPNFFNRENNIIGSSINQMIPQSLHASHDAILKDFSQHEIMQRALKDISIVIGVDQNGWSVAYQLKIQAYHDVQSQEIGICAWIRRPTLTSQLANIVQESHFISANLANNGNIINTSEYFFDEILNKYFHLRDIQQVSLFSMIPALEGIINKYNSEFNQKNHSKLVGEIYETLLVQITPEHRQTNWMREPYRQQMIESISQRNLYWIQLEVSIIKNKYMHILQLEIKNMRHLQVKSNLNNSIDNGYTLLYKAEGLKSLCLQLLCLGSWTQEEIAQQFQDLTINENSPQLISDHKAKNNKKVCFEQQNTMKDSKNAFKFDKQQSQPVIQSLKNLSITDQIYNYDKDYEIIHLKQVKNEDENKTQATYNQNTLNHINSIIIQNLSNLNIGSMSGLSPINNNNEINSYRVGQSYNELTNSLIHINNDDSNLNNSIHNYHNLTSQRQHDQEDKITSRNNLNQTLQELDQKQIYQQLFKNSTIENMFQLSPQNRDSSPINIQNHPSIIFNNSSNRLQEPLRLSMNSFPSKHHKGKPCSADKNSSMNIGNQDASSLLQRVVRLQPAYNQQQYLSQIVDVENEESINSSTKSADSTLKREIIRNIKSEKRMIVLKVINLMGIIAIFVLFSLNAYNFFRLKSSLKEQKRAFHLIDWCDSVRLSLAYSLSDMYLLKLMENNIVKFGSLSQKKEYIDFTVQRLNNSYTTYKSLMQIYTSQDKNEVKIFNTLLDTKLNISLWARSDSYTNTTQSLAYGLMGIVGHMYKYANLKDDRTNIHFYNSNNNYEQMILLLQELQDTTSSDFNYMLDDILENQIYQMISVFITTFAFSLSVLPTYSFIQVKREEILKLLSTIQPDKLRQMMATLIKNRSKINQILQINGQTSSSSPSNRNQLQQASYEVNSKKKQTVNIHNTVFHDNDILFFSHTQIQKKKNISNVNRISRFSFKILFWVLLFFIIMQLYSISILYFVFNFKKNSHDNRNIMTSLTQTKSHTSAFYAMNQVSIISLLLPQYTIPPLEKYLNRSFYLHSQSIKVLNDLYDSQKSLHSYEKYGQSYFDEFLQKVFEKDACEVINQYPQYYNGTKFDYNTCKTIQKSELKEGLINAVKAIFIQLEQEVQLFKIKNIDSFKAQLTKFQEQNNFVIMDKFRNQIDSVIETSLNFMYNMSDRLFDYVIAANHILISLQIVIVVIVIFLGWFRYYSKILELLQKTKYTLDIFEVSILLENPYLMSYFKKSS